MAKKQLPLFFAVPLILLLARNDLFFKHLLHAPHKISFAVFLDHFLLTPFMLVFLCLGAYSLGHWFLTRIVKADFYGVIEDLAFSIPCGFGFFSVIVLAFGLNGILNPWLFSGLIALAIVLSAKRILAVFIKLRDAFRSFVAEAASASFHWIEIVSANIVLWVLLHGWILSLAPATDSDSNAYHLANPANYIRAGKIYFQEGNLFGAFPGNIEMNYLLALLIKGEELAKLIPWVMSVLLVALIANYGVRFFKDRKIGMLGAAIFAAQPIFSSFLGTAMQDSCVALYIFLSIYAVSAWFEDRKISWMILAGIGAGLAAGTKLQGVPFTLVLLFVLGCFQITLKRLDIKALALFALFFALFASPSYVRNWSWTGNPFWPLLYSVFDGKGLNADHARALDDQEIQPGQERTLHAWFNLPVKLITQMRFGNYYNPEYLTWPFLIVLWALFFVRPKIPWMIYFFAAFAVLGTIPIFSTPTFWRYFLPALPGVCLIFSWGIVQLTQHGTKFAAAILVLLVVAVVRLKQEQALFPVMGYSLPGSDLGPRESYLEECLGYYPVYRYAKSRLPEDAKVLLVEQSDSYHLGRAALASDPLYQTLIDFRNIDSKDKLKQRLRELGLTHVLYNEKGKIVVNPWRRLLLPQWYWQGQGLIRQILIEDSTLMIKINETGLYALS